MIDIRSAQSTALDDRDLARSVIKLALLFYTEPNTVVCCFTQHAGAVEAGSGLGQKCVQTLDAVEDGDWSICAAL